MSIKRYHQWLLVSSLGLVTLPVKAQDPTIFQPLQPPKEMRAVRATGPISINGRLDEADWQTAPATTGFFQVQPD